MGKISTLIACVALIAGEAVADGRKPGSVLVFPAQRTNAAGFTIVSVTNTHVQPQTPTSFGGSTNVHFEYHDVILDPARPTHAAGKSVFDRVEFLSPADTLSVLTACHDPQWGQGFLVVSAEDPGLYRTPWSHDRLIGSALHLASSGATYWIHAIPFGSPVAAGLPTDLDGDMELDFDGLEYEKPARTLLVDSFLAIANTELCLVEFSGVDGASNDLLLSVWNDNERALSTTIQFTCWFELPLAAISPLFSESFLRGVQNDPEEFDVNCDRRGDLETGWIKIESRGLRVNGTKVADRGDFLGCLMSGPYTGLAFGRLMFELP